VIVGSGPAGYTAAIYAARANLSPVVITGFKDGGIPGGQLMTTTHVENFPGFPDGILGPELMDRIKAQAVRWGTRLVEADADAIDLSQRPFRIQAEGRTIETQAVILATGASANRLGLPSEERFWNAGISACAICDGATPQFRDVDLAVVGGGDSACEEAVYLTKYASRVHLIVRGDKLRASKAMADRVLANSSIQVHWNRQVADCTGTEWLEAIDLRDSVNGSSERLPVRGLFYAIGHTPNTRLVQGQLETDAKGYLITRPGHPETSLEGVYAAGDVADAEWRPGDHGRREWLSGRPGGGALAHGARPRRHRQPRSGGSRGGGGAPAHGGERRGQLRPRCPLAEGELCPAQAVSRQQQAPAGGLHLTYLRALPRASSPSSSGCSTNWAAGPRGWRSTSKLSRRLPSRPVSQAPPRFSSSSTRSSNSSSRG